MFCDQRAGQAVEGADCAVVAVARARPTVLRRGVDFDVDLGAMRRTASLPSGPSTVIVAVRDGHLHAGGERNRFFADTGHVISLQPVSLSASQSSIVWLTADS